MELPAAFGWFVGHILVLMESDTKSLADKYTLLSFLKTWYMLIVDLTTVYCIIYPRDNLTSLGLECSSFCATVIPVSAMKFLRNFYESFPQLDV